VTTISTPTFAGFGVAVKSEIVNLGSVATSLALTFIFLKVISDAIIVKLKINL